MVLTCSGIMKMTMHKLRILWNSLVRADMKTPKFQRIIPYCTHCTDFVLPKCFIIYNVIRPIFHLCSSLGSSFTHCILRLLLFHKPAERSLGLWNLLPVSIHSSFPLYYGKGSNPVLSHR